jgi:hypothetical protein
MQRVKRKFTNFFLQRNIMSPRFKLTKSDASNSLEEWRKNFRFSPSKWGVSEGKFEKYYIPYWNFKSQGPITYKARISEEKFIKSFENGEEKIIRKLDWRSISGSFKFPVSDSVYASEQFSRYHLDEIKPEFENVFTVTPRDQRDAKVDLYMIDKSTGWNILFQKRFKETAKDMIVNDIQKKFQKTEKLLIELTNIYFDMNDIEASLIYHPMYISEYVFGGRNFFIYVNGVNGIVNGERLFSFSKVASVSFASMLASSFLVIGTKALNPFLVSFFGFISLPIGSLFYFLPFFRSIRRNMERNMRMEQFRREEQENKYQKHEEYQQNPFPSNSQVNFYTVLGLNPSKSKSYTNDEIRKSFLIKAKEFHPDKFPEGKEKENAHKKFTEINQAYQTLKDEKMRAKYDFMRYQ